MRQKSVRALLFLAFFGLGCCGTSALAAKARPSWRLVTFAAKGPATQMTAAKRAPFDGIAAPIVTAYDTQPNAPMPRLERRFLAMQRYSGKQIWPWVFINRMLGPGPTRDNPQALKPYFEAIRTMDLDNITHARERFMSDWRTSLRLARAINSPGVVLDLEFYNNPSIAYAMSRFAEQIGMPAAVAGSKLEQLGNEMGMLVAKEYPTAKIWILNAALDNPADQTIGGRAYFEPRGEIAYGIVDELARLHAPAIVIDGGEDTLGYCQPGISALRAKIDSRAARFAQLQHRYPGYIALAGTVTLWGDAREKKGWLAQSDCGASGVETAEDFIPYLRVLNDNYSYNWIYATPIGGYDPFDASAAGRFNKVIRKGRD